jgi:hypothetical protein
MRFLPEHDLSLVVLLAFLILWASQSVTGCRVHGQPAEDFTTYLPSSHFWQATGENWESD